jgi:translation initiation factor 1 (eIF-1/SUI1)
LFTLGIWTNYEQLEENLSMPELLATLDSYREQKERDRKFAAAIQGIDLDSNDSKEERDFNEVKRRAKAKAAGKDPDANDVLELQGRAAEEAGFGINNGLLYEVE